MSHPSLTLVWGLYMSKKSQNISAEEFTRLANNFYIANDIPGTYERIQLDSQLVNYVLTHTNDLKKRFKVALCFICINPPYWEFIPDAVAGARNLFLPGHDVDMFLWSDLPEKKQDIYDRMVATADATQLTPEIIDQVQALAQNLETTRSGLDVTEMYPIDWPMGTLQRYAMMLQREEDLKKYDYVFYCDIDMRFVGVVGDEILGKGLTAAQHPMYALRKEYNPPYEPNKDSAAYIKRPGKVILEGDKPRFVPLYFAGGFQGGKTKDWIKAMKAMKKSIDKDFTNNYIAIWNDESHWNKYLNDHEPDVVLTPSYIYPDSLINEYYKKIWGTEYQPKLVTLTKKFTTSTEGGAAVNQMINDI